MEGPRATSSILDFDCFLVVGAAPLGIAGDGCVVALDFGIPFLS